MSYLRIITLFLASIFIISNTTFAQSSKEDSLYYSLNNHQRRDTVRVNILNDLSFHYYFSDSKKAREYALSAFSLSDSLNYIKGKVIGLRNIGLSYLRGDINKSLSYFEDGYKLAESASYKEGCCICLISIGNVWKELGNISKSSECHNRALTIATSIKNDQLVLKCRINLARNLTQIGNHIEAIEQYHDIIRSADDKRDTYLLSSVYSNLANIHQFQGNYSQSLEYYYKSLDLYKKYGNINGINSLLTNISGVLFEQKDYDGALKNLNELLNNALKQKDTILIATCYSNIGNIYIQMHHPDAMKYIQNAFELSKNRDIYKSINNLQSMGALYSEEGNVKKALEVLNEALILSRSCSDKRNEANTLLKISKLYISNGMSQKALKYALLANTLGVKYKYNDIEKYSNSSLATIYASTGNYKLAYLSLQKFYEIEKNIYNEKEVRKTALLESSYKFEQERKILEIEQDEQKTKIRYLYVLVSLLVIVLLLVAVLSFFAHKSYKEKKRRLSVEIELKNKEIENLDKEMALAKLRLIQNAEQDSRNAKILESIAKTEATSDEKIQELISNYKFQNSNSSWDEFEIIFKKLNSKFWEELNNISPALTPNEKKICVFLKLNMSNKDISNITLQSEDALKKSRQRLRVKLNIDKDVNLINYIQSLQ